MRLHGAANLEFAPFALPVDIAEASCSNGASSAFAAGGARKACRSRDLVGSGDPAPTNAMTLAAEHFPSNANAMEDDPVDGGVAPDDDPMDRMANYFGFGRRNSGAAERGDGGDNKHQLSHFVSPVQR